MLAQKTLKNMILDIRRTAAVGTGKDLITHREAAALIGVSHGSVANWEAGLSPPTEENVTKVQDALAKLKAGNYKPPTPKKSGKVVAVGGDSAKIGSLLGANTKLVPHNTKPNRIKALLGVDDTEKKSDARPVIEKRTEPKKPDSADRYTMKLPSGAQGDLKKVISVLGVKPFSPASGFYDKTEKRVHWQFAAWFTVDAMKKIIARHNERNRVVGDARSVIYGKDILNGDWLYTAEPIIFSDKADLLDGQNRLIGAISANLPMPFAVAIGQDPAIFPVLGSGLSRNSVQRGVAAGWSFAPVRLRTIALLHRYEHSDKDADYLEQPTPMSFHFGGPADMKINDHYGSELDSALDYVHGLGWSIGNKALPKFVGAFALLFLSRASADVARHFMRLLVNGGAIPGSPIAGLRENLVKLSTKRPRGTTEVRLRNAEIIRTICACWNSYCSGRQNASGKFVSKDAHRTSEYVGKHLVSPMQRVVDEAVKETGPDVVAAHMARAKALRQKELASIHAKLTDKGGVKVARVRRKLGTS